MTLRYESFQFEAEDAGDIVTRSCYIRPSAWIIIFKDEGTCLTHALYF